MSDKRKRTPKDRLKVLKFKRTTKPKEPLEPPAHVPEVREAYEEELFTHNQHVRQYKQDKEDLPEPPDPDQLLIREDAKGEHPSNAEDYIEGRLDLNRHLIKHPAATFFVKVSGDSMIKSGIHPGDLLVVDRAVEPTDGRVVIAVIDGELTVKRLKIEGERISLEPDNESYSPLEISSAMEFEVWGVVTWVVHTL